MSIMDLAYKRRDECLVPKLPENCPPILAEICESCWEADPELRPSFKMILRKFSQWEKQQAKQKPKDSDDEDDEPKTPRNAKESRSRQNSIVGDGEEESKKRRAKDKKEPKQNAFENPPVSPRAKKNE
jgi:hypothetical protein